MGNETDMEVNIHDIWQELDELLTKRRISKWSMKKSLKKYCFEVRDVPVSADWIELTYSYECEYLMLHGFLTMCRPGASQ